jgi:hypothetical protein
VLEFCRNVETKRRFNNILHASGLIDKLQQVKPRPATVPELCRCACNNCQRRHVCLMFRALVRSLGTNKRFLASCRLTVPPKPVECSASDVSKAAAAASAHAALRHLMCQRYAAH